MTALKMDGLKVGQPGRNKLLVLIYDLNLELKNYVVEKNIGT